MDRKKIEKYLRIYPHIDKEIARLENELANLKTKKEKYNTFQIDESVNDILETIEKTSREYLSDLNELYKIKSFIPKALNRLTTIEIEIIRLRLWDEKYSVAKWSDIAKAVNYHKKSAERLYRETLKKVAGR